MSLHSRTWAIKVCWSGFRQPLPFMEGRVLWTQLGLSSTWEGKEEEALAEAWLVSEELGDLGCGRPGGTWGRGRGVAGAESSG